MIPKIEIGDQIWHNKYGQTKCVKFFRNENNQLMAVGKNGTFAPVEDWVKLANPLPERKDEENAKEIHLD